MSELAVCCMRMNSDFSLNVGSIPTFAEITNSAYRNKDLFTVDVDRVPFMVITEGVQIRKILDHIGVDSEPPHISPARGPPLWDDCSDAQMDDEVQIEPADWDLAPQAAPDFEVDQRINW